MTKPDSGDRTQEGETARFLASHKIPDRYLALGLDLLARDIDDKRQDLVFIDYKSLGVRQLGSIYEGLLEFRVRIAQEKMAVVKGKKTEEVIPYQGAVKSKKRVLTRGRGRNAQERVYQVWRCLPGERPAGTEGLRLLLHPRPYREVHRREHGGAGPGREVREAAPDVSGCAASLPQGRGEG